MRETVIEIEIGITETKGRNVHMRIVNEAPKNVIHPAKVVVVVRIKTNQMNVSRVVEGR